MEGSGRLSTSRALPFLLHRGDYNSMNRPAASRESGFTMIELMVVVLIIAILLAIAIPTFLGARRRAQNRAAQASLRIAVTAEMAYMSSGAQTFTSNPNVLQAEEYGLYWMGPNPSTHFKEVSVDYFDDDYLCLAVFSPSGDTFGMIVETVPPGQTLYGSSVPTRASDFCAGHVPGTIPGVGNWSPDPATAWAV
jgi:type IV pilus assembly protein PilA